MKTRIKLVEEQKEPEGDRQTYKHSQDNKENRNELKGKNKEKMEDD